MPAGRPTKYNNEYHPKLAYQCGRNGMTDVEFAKFLDISEKTLYTWKIEHKEFLQALKKGKEDIDQGVENALLRRALGYKTTEQKVSSGKIYDVEKEILPEVVAQIFWLKNRRPEQWRDKKELDIDGNISFTIDKAEEDI